MTVGVSTTVIHNTLEIAVYVFLLFNITTLQVFVTYLTGAPHVHSLWFYKHQHDNQVLSKLFVACQRWWGLRQGSGLFNRTTLQVFVTYLTVALYVHPLWFYKHQHDNRVRSKLFVACQRWWGYVKDQVYLIEQYSKFLLHTLQLLYMCSLCDSTDINMIIEFVPNCS